MKNGFYKLVSLALALMTLILPGNLSSGERRGARVIITLKDGQKAEGELIAVKPDSLLLFSGKDESVELVGIRSIRVVRKSKALLGALCGLGAGAGGAAIYIASTKTPNNLLGVVKASLGVAGAVTLFPLAGLGIGIGIGALAGTDRTIELEGKSESEVRQALAYLRGKARVRDFK